MGPIILLLGLAALAPAQPVVDHHQHFFHPEETGLPAGFTVTAKELVAHLDAAKIRRAVVLSLSYQFGNPNRPPVENEYDKVRAENDWTAEQVSHYPDRLIGFCGFNPLRDYALAELARCAKDARLRRGIKMHFGNSDVDLNNPDHVERLRQVFTEANRHRMAIIVHLRSSVTRKRPFGANEARVFLNQFLPLAPRITVQIAHLCGAGGYEEPGVDEALAVFVEAVAKKDRRVSRLYIDISGITLPNGAWKPRAELIANRVRQLGLKRVLYGSDGAGPGNTPAEYHTRFRELPLTSEEFRAMEANVAPYLK